MRAVKEVTRGGSACGPPPEPDSRVPALTRAACASSGMSSTATQLVSCSYQRLTYCTYCSYFFVQLCYILHIMQLCFIQLCLHTSLFAAVYKKCSDRYLMFRSVFKVLFLFQLSLSLSLPYKFRLTIKSHLSQNRSKSSSKNR